MVYADPTGEATIGGSGGIMDDHPSLNVANLPPAMPGGGLDKAILDAGDEIGIIAKEYNKDLRYSVRGWETILNRIAPILRSHGLLIYPEDEEVSYRETNGLPKVVLRVKMVVRHTTGEEIAGYVTASCAEFLRKANGELSSANNNPEGSARTYAEREFVCRLFKIPSAETPEFEDAGMPAPKADAPQGDPTSNPRQLAATRIKNLPENLRAPVKDWMEDQGLWYTPNDWTPDECAEIINRCEEAPDVGAEDVME